jgi:type III restriction enzyme
LAAERIVNGITKAFEEKRPIKILPDPYNPIGSTVHVKFNTSKTDRWETDSNKCHINWAILDSDWEGEFCRVVEKHPRVKAYVKNHNLGLEIPYRHGSETHNYLPDYIVVIDDDKGEDDFLHLIVEVKGYRNENAKDKKATIETYWVPGVNNSGLHGRWAFAEFRDPYAMASELNKKITQAVNEMIESVLSKTSQTSPCVKQ